jgi:hypothetical protein
VTEPTPEPTPQPTDGGAPSGYTPPATQQDLNKLLGERAARERAKFADYEDLKGAAARIPELEEKAAQAEAAIAEVPSKVAAELRAHLIALHEIPDDKAELFLTATDPALLVRQVTALVGETKKQGNTVPREGGNPTPGGSNRDEREFVRNLFGSVD